MNPSESEPRWKTGKAVTVKSSGLEENAWLDLVQVEGHRRLPAAQNHAVEQVMDAVERPLAAVNVQFFDGLPAHERGEQPRQAEDVVQVAVGDENVVQVPEADAGLQDLALGAFAAVDQEAEFVVLDDLRRKPALGRGGGGGGAEEDDFEHCGNYTLPMVEAVSCCHRPYQAHVILKPKTVICAILPAGSIIPAG